MHTLFTQYFVFGPCNLYSIQNNVLENNDILLFFYYIFSSQEVFE